MIETILYRTILLDAWADYHGIGWLSKVCGRLYRVIYRYRCPYPVIEDWSVKACIASGNCSCDNAPGGRHS